MAHDVFLSYASTDQTVAQMVCATLEKNGIRCWMAPRDVQPGDDWGNAIVEAIKASRAMVLVFSGAANDSRHIPREIERAMGREIPIVPVRIENVEPRGSLEYSLSSVHWLDAISPPVEAHITKLAARLRTMLHLSGEGAQTPPTVVPGPEAHESHADVPAVVVPVMHENTTGTKGAGSSKRLLIIAAGAIAGVAALAYALSDRPPAPVSTSTGSNTTGSTVSPPPPPAATTVSPPPQATNVHPERTVVPPPVRSSVPLSEIKWSAYPTHKVIREIDQQEINRLKAAANARRNDERPAIDLGDIYYDARQYDLAIDWYLDALELTPNDVEVRIDLAMAYWHSKRSATAMTHLRRVLTLAPRHALALLNMGVVHATSDMLDEAADCWRGVIQYNPGTWAAERARELLGKVGR